MGSWISGGSEGGYLAKTPLPYHLKRNESFPEEVPNLIGYGVGETIPAPYRIQYIGKSILQQLVDVFIAPPVEKVFQRG